MNDLRSLLADPMVAKANLKRRHVEAKTLHVIDQLAALSTRRTELVTERDQLRADRNRLSKEIGGMYKAGRPDDAAAIKATVQAGNERIAVIEQEIHNLEDHLGELQLELPNLVQEDTPEGASEEDNPEVDRWGTPRVFEFEPQAHVEVGAHLGILDLERSAKLSGARFSVLYGMGAKLERALINFFLDVHTGEHGYLETMTPYIVGSDALVGVGQLPKFADDMFKLAKPVNGMDAYLISTAEVPVTNLHREEILEEEAMPRKFACFTPCFRAEAGSAGRDVRGLIRTHQFHKVELVVICKPEDSAAYHQALLGHAQTILQRLELPYRTVRLCGGDISFSAEKCYDIEVWLPSQDQYREISSVSNFGTFQSRRMNLRYRPNSVDGKKQKPQFCHTINGSGLAVGRTLVAILENYQQADGSVVVPDVLRPYVGADVIPVPG